MSVADLPTLNALLNGTAALLLLAGWWNIRHGRIDVHRRFMIAAFVTSALFLASYLVYHAQAGSRAFSGTGLTRTVYLTILFTHIVLAAAILPMALLTLARGLRRDDERHRRLARWTLPVWMYVSVTGVVIYLMLYHWYP